ncbi:hypothetical protein H7J81_17890 [Mycobacterium cookii]|uniref:hypothetical protein n=1 Tax=Mycobacterium cookii TaxID=1775 RepID=UPI0013D203B2|nr:hypothetical protein [Mycobacterium cookii]MCV7331975.1 hypothetical protein [Mycobacterium cookii]
MSRHQAAVLAAAIRCIATSPELNPSGHVVIYVDHLLSVFDVAPTELHKVGSLRQRLAHLRDRYTRGIAMLDELAGGDFAAAPLLHQNLILSRSQVAPFASLLFDHCVEATCAPPLSARRGAADCSHKTGKHLRHAGHGHPVGSPSSAS